ncbi:hypothetical protein LDENG_00099850 [Lucifuga dentata]|nr:hypothetical protein LDENG_00099850 [Lucifuga dentata]
MIHVVTDQEAQQGVYSLGQVLLPMPGNTVKYPENAMGTWYQERLSRDGLEDCRFRVGGLKLNLPGCYRPLLAFPRNLTHRLQRAAGGGGGGRSDRIHQWRGDKKSAVKRCNFRQEAGFGFKLAHSHLEFRPGLFLLCHHLP